MVCEECKKPYDWKEIVSSPFGLNCDYIFCKGWGRFGKIHFDNGKEMHDECFSFYKKIKSGERTEIEELAEIKSIWYEHYLKSHRMMKERISNYFIERFGEKLTLYQV